MLSSFLLPRECDSRVAWTRVITRCPQSENLDTDS